MKLRGWVTLYKADGISRFKLITGPLYMYIMGHKNNLCTSNRTILVKNNVIILEAMLLLVYQVDQF